MNGTLNYYIFCAVVSFISTLYISIKQYDHLLFKNEFLIYLGKN